MNLLILLGTIGAGLGLSAGAAFNLRLLHEVRVPLASTLVNFLGGTLLLFLLWGLGVNGARPDHWPPAWMLIGGLLGSTYVTLNLIGAARLGIGVSTVAVTLGQVLSALIITSQGWFGQAARQPTPQAWLSAALLLCAVALLGLDRIRQQKIGT